MNKSSPTAVLLTCLTVGFAALAMGFVLNLWGRPAPLPEIPLVDRQFTNTATVRTNLAALIRLGEDVSDFDCYFCHDRKKSPPLRFDPAGNLIVPKEHENIVMGHGRHNRNNLCFNCHDEVNLELLQTRDGRQLKLAESTPLCGSCHGPTFRDWDAGVHGRTSGYWDRTQGAMQRQDCAACHNPHSPRFPGRAPAPGPHPLRARGRPTPTEERKL